MSVQMITRDTIEKHMPFILKWSRSPRDTKGVINPAWKQQTEVDRLLDLIQDTPTLLNDARFIPMESIEHDVNYMRVKARLQSMKKLSGQDKGAPLQTDYTTAIEETVPEFTREKLEAEPFSIFTYTSKLFLLENIEKESFLPHIEAILAERAGFSAELIGLYGIKDEATTLLRSLFVLNLLGLYGIKDEATTNPDGIHQINGIFKQLQDIKKNYPTNVKIDRKAPMGCYNDIDASKELVPQIKKLITQFTKQRGNRSKAKIYVSTEMEGLLMMEADKRQTERGDTLYFDDNGQLTLWGVPIVRADSLDVPENNIGEQVLMADPDSIVFGFLSEITSENEYKLEYKSYLSTVDVYFDVLLLYHKDALSAHVINIPSGDDGDSPSP